MMRRSLFALVGVVAVLASAVPGRAAPRVDADSDNEYRVTPEAGPWLIIVKTYKGPLAPQLAHELILLVRKRDNLPAYLFVRGEEERRQQEEQINQIRRLCPDVPNARIRRVRIDPEYAVLVGGYPDIDSARRALNDIKRLSPPDDERLMDKLTAVGPAPGGGGKGVVRVAAANPFVTGFVVPNPMVPQEPVDRSKPDPALKALNEGRPYNLLACRHPWTLVIKDFQGAAVLQSQSSSGSFLGSLFGVGDKDVLAASGQQAEEVARVLREHLHFDAYVLHTRTSSIVTVGAYDSSDDPRLRQVQRQLANLQLGPIQCFAQPLPMQVPQP
jgi:hypothetical protein